MKRGTTSAARVRAVLGPLLAGLLMTLATGAQAAAMTVYKTATCGCCAAWVEHVRAAGFDVTVHDVSRAELVERKQELGVDRGLSACHTAVVNDYVVEGHVPAADIRRMLREAPPIAGIAVPGMPQGSPGMEYGDRVEPYNVVAFGPQGSMSIFARHGR